MKTGDHCPCGQSLPWHLLELGLGSTFSHTCRCGRRFKTNQLGEVAMEEGFKPNPFAAFDRSGTGIREIVDAWLLDQAQTWEDAAIKLGHSQDSREQGVCLLVLEGMPHLPGHITIADCIAELRSRAVRK